jgi:nucleoside phosphorylase
MTFYPDFPTVDFLIVTALEKEATPLRKVFQSKSIPKEWYDSIRYDEAQIKTSFEWSYRVRLVCVGDQGANYTAAVLASTLRTLRPRYVIMAGIAAIVPGEGRRLKDVLISTHIVDLSDQKIWPSHTEVGKRVFPCDRELVKEADRFCRESKKWSALARPGAIVSQKDLIKSAEQREMLVDFVSTTEPGLRVVGLEREGAGVGVASEITSSDLRPGILMVKSAVDFANYHKDDSVQRTAAQRSARFLLEFLHSGPV